MKYSFIILSLLFLTWSYGQDNVKKFTYKGNNNYHNSNYSDASYFYQKALDESNFNYTANYNLANTQFRLEEYEKAIEIYEKIAEFTETKLKKSHIYHNIGNCYMMQKDLEKAIESYKTALRANPLDEETRYNLAYALEQKKKEDEQKKNDQKDKQDDNKDKQDQDKKDNKDENKDKQDKDNKDKQDKDNKDKKDKDQNKDGDKQEDDKESDKNEQPKDNKGAPPKKMSKAQAKRILDAANKKEKELQGQLNSRRKFGKEGEKGKEVTPVTKKDW